VIQGQTGFVVNTPEGAAYRMRYLLQHPNIGAEIGQKGREYVRENFLITKQLSAHLTLIYVLLHNDTDRIELQDFVSPKSSEEQ
jgi:trehalose synthase